MSNWNETSFGTFHGPRRPPRASAKVYPDRWLKVDRATGCVLGAFSGPAPPSTRGWNERHLLVEIGAAR